MKYEAPEFSKNVFTCPHCDTNAESGLSFLPMFLTSDSEDHAKTEIVLMLQAVKM